MIAAVTRARSAVADSVLAALGTQFSPIIARSILRSALNQAGMSPAQLERRGMDRELLAHLSRGLRMFARDLGTRNAAVEALEALIVGRSGEHGAEKALIGIVHENDIVAARQRARGIATSVGFDPTTRIKIATAVSELARNVFRYAGGGEVRLHELVAPRPGIEVIATDEGPGIDDLELVLSGRYLSKTGMGLGLLGCKRLMDQFDVQTSPAGTRVVARKYLSP